MDYFGNNSAGDGDSALSGYIAWNDNSGVVWTCPGSGLQKVNELGVLVYVTSGSANVRCGIYNSSGNLVMQGSAKIAVTETDSAGVWKTHTSFVDGAGNAITTPQLTGGQNYYLVNTGDGTTLRQRRTAVTSGYTKYRSSEYTSDMPDTIPASPTNGTNLACIRCGVTPASSGISIPVLQSSYRRRRS